MVSYGIIKCLNICRKFARDQIVFLGQNTSYLYKYGIPNKMTLLIISISLINIAVVGRCLWVIDRTNPVSLRWHVIGLTMEYLEWERRTWEMRAGWKSWGTGSGTVISTNVCWFDDWSLHIGKRGLPELNKLMKVFMSCGNEFYFCNLLSPAIAGI